MICLWAVSLWCSVWGTYPVNSYMVSDLFEGRIHWWSKSEAGWTTFDCHLLDLLFLTAFGPRGLLCCVGSICSSEEPLSFHAKRFPVALAASFFRFGGIQCLFAVYCYFLSFYFGFSLFSYFFSRYIPFISAYALCPATMCDLGKSETERKNFSHAYALFPAP